MERLRFQKITANADEVDTGDGRTIPGLFEAGSGMRRFVTDRNLDYRAGYTKVPQGQGFKTFFWYDEFWVVLEGHARVHALDRPTEKTWDEEIGVRDLVYIPSGTKVTLRVPKSDPYVLFFYIALPASNKHARWMSYMKPEDLEDIRARGEYTPEGFEAEAGRGQPRVGVS